MFTACGFPEGPRTTLDARAAKDGGIQAGIWVILILSNAFCSVPSVSGRRSGRGGCLRRDQASWWPTAWAWRRHDKREGSVSRW